MRLLFAALALVVGTLPACSPVARPSLAGHSAHGRRQTEPHGTRAAWARRQAGFDGHLGRSGIPKRCSTRPMKSRGSTSSFVSVSASTTRGVPRISACRAVLRSTGFGVTKRILQTPTTIVILNDDLTYRVIFMDGRELEANPAPSWMGYSVGRWEGDTLVVDSNGFNDKTWLSRYGQAHTRGAACERGVPTPRLRPPQMWR